MIVSCSHRNSPWLGNCPIDFHPVLQQPFCSSSVARCPHDSSHHLKGRVSALVIHAPAVQSSQEESSGLVGETAIHFNPAKGYHICGIFRPATKKLADFFD